MDAKSQGEKSTKTERNSAFEILRIIAILFIIAHHFSIHGRFDFSGLENTTLILANKTWTDFILQLGEAGVNIFVLISAYFLVDSKFKTKRVLSIIFEMLTFSIVIGSCFLIFDHKEASLSVFRNMLLPFGTNQWWFMTSYLLIYLFSPLLNLGIKAMNKKMHLFFIVLFVVIWSIVPTFLQTDYDFSRFGWFITLYLIASYIKVYNIEIKCRPWLGIVLSCCMFLVFFAIKCAITLAADSDNSVANFILGWFNLVDINNFMQLLFVVLLFLSFKKIKMKNIKFINVIASATMAIYLFHDHSDVRNYLWIRLFKNASWSASPYLIPYSIGVILAVFAVGVIIGLIYRYSFNLLYNKFLSYLNKKLFDQVDNIINHRNANNEVL